MKFEEPKVEFVQFDSETVVVTSATGCTDGSIGGTIECTGSAMDDYCGAPMAATQ